IQLTCDDPDMCKHLPVGSSIMVVSGGRPFRTSLLNITYTIGSYGFQLDVDPVTSNDPATGGTWEIYVQANNYVRPTIDLAISNNYSGDDKQYLKSLITQDATA